MATASFSTKDPTRRSKHFGPYRATKLWNELLRAFRVGMPVRRHRRHMKSHDDCFSGTEAVSWLLDHLRSNPNYGPTVTRSQAVQLLDKFHKWRVFEDVRGGHKNGDAFTDGGRLFRFIQEVTAQTPVKGRTGTPARVPLATRTALMNGAASPQLKPAANGLVKPQLPEKKTAMEARFDPENKSLQSSGIEAFKPRECMDYEASTISAPAEMVHRKPAKTAAAKSACEPARAGRGGGERAKRPLSVSEAVGGDSELTGAEREQVWKTMLLNRLQSVLRVSTLTEVLNADDVNAADVIHNMTHVNKIGVVTNIKEQDQLPHWVLRAMRYLAYWPESVEDVPRYEGFVRDVFNAITDDYLAQLQEPLCSYAMYDVFTSVLACLEAQEPVRMPEAATPQRGGGAVNPYNSLESLMADLTVDALGSPLGAAVGSPLPPKDIMIVHDSEVLTRTLPDLLQTCTSTTSGARSMKAYHSSASLNGSVSSKQLFGNVSGTRYETSFGVDNREPRTRLVSNKSVGDVRMGFESSAQNSLACHKSMADLRDVKTAVHDKNNNNNQHRHSINSASSHGQSRVGFGRDSWTADQRRSICGSVTSQQSRSSLRNSSQSPNEIDNSRKSSGDSYKGSTSTVGRYPSVGSDVFTSVADDLFTDEERQRLGLKLNCHGEDKSRYPSGGYRPRTCPLNGTYRSSSSLTDKLVSGSQVPPPYIPPPKYEERTGSYHNTYSPPYNSSNSNLSPSPTRVSARSIDGARLARGSESVFYASERSIRTETTSAVNGTSRAATHRAPSTRSQTFSQRARSSETFMERVTADIADRSRGGQSLGRASGARHQLTESYLMATDRESFTHTPAGKSLFGSRLSRAQSTPNLALGGSRLLEALQLCTLMLPPPSRRKLHLLLRFMSALVANKQLTLDKTASNRELVLMTFSRCVLRSAEDTEYNTAVSGHIVAFMMEHYRELMQVPDTLLSAIRAKLADLSHSKREFFRLGFERGVTYCRQVSLAEYEQQRHTGARDQLTQLLNAILSDTRMGAKERKKRLKQFQRAHPDIYQRRFPSSRSESELANLKPKLKQPLLTRPLLRIKSLRL